LANALKSLGDLESRLGQVDVARGYYEEAIEYYKSERAKLGLANVNLMLGILNRSESEWDNAVKNFAQAFELFSAEREPMGLAYTCAELIRCEKHGGVAAEAIRPLVIQALTSAEASGVPSVVEYVNGVLVEFFDGNREQAQAFLHELLSASEGE
jgi:tetratricopeptide (TPR) repeat protein